MSDGNGEGRDASGRRFHLNMDDARARAQEALHKSEFILSRAYGLFRDPKKEWEQIRDEETSIPNILLGCVAPLAVLQPLCGLIGLYVWGERYGDQTVRPEIGSALVGAVVTWIIGVALVFMLGILINAVAANFDADKNEIAAQKISAYSLTPFFLSGVFWLWPPLWWVSLFALAAMVFLMYRGLPVLMKAPEDRALGYATTVTIAAAVTAIVLLALSSCVT